MDYVTLDFPETTKIYPDVLPVPSTKSPKPYRPPQWTPERQQHIDCLYTIFPQQVFVEYCNRILVNQGQAVEPGPLDLSTFRTLIQEIHRPAHLRSTWIKDLHPDYFFVTQLGGLVYDLCRFVRSAGEYGIVEIYNLFHGCFNDTDELITSDEFKILYGITKLYYETTTPHNTSTKELARIVVDKSVGPIDLFYKMVQAIAVAYLGKDSITRFRRVGWYVHLIGNGLNLPEPVTGRARLGRLVFEEDGGSGVRYIPLSSHNIDILLRDPMGAFTRPIEFSWYDYLTLTGKSKEELQEEIVDVLMDRIEVDPPTIRPARSTIESWYRTDHTNKLSKGSIEDLVERLADYPRVEWDKERIEMTIRRICSINYSIEDFIDEYDEEYLEATIQSKKNQVNQTLRSFYPHNGCYLIPLLSQRGLLLIYKILETDVPIWTDRLLANSIKWARNDFLRRYGIDGLILSKTEWRVLSIDLKWDEEKQKGR